MRRNCLLFFGAARCAVLAAGATFRDYLAHQQSVLSRMNTSCA